MSAAEVAAEVVAERARQDAKWGQQDHPDACPVLLAGARGPGPFQRAWNAQDRAEAAGIPTAARAKRLCQSAADEGRTNWSAILVEEVAEAVEAIGDDVELRAELLQVAAVATAWVEAIDRRLAGGAP